MTEPATAVDIAELQHWVGRSETARDTITSFTINGRRVESNAADLWVSSDGGVLHMEARAEWK